MTNHFDQLVPVLGDYPNAMDASSLHGFLTALAIGPSETLEQPWLQAILGLPPKTVLTETMEALETTAMLAVDQTLEEIAEECFHPRINISDTDSETLKAWCHGFRQAMLLAESKWEAFHNACPDAARIRMTITALIQPELAEAVFGISPENHAAFVVEQTPLLGSIIESYYQILIESMVENIDPKPPTMEGLPQFDRDKLTKESNDDLLHLLRILDDDLPYEVVLECIQRKAPMVAILNQYLADDKRWDEAQDYGGDCFWTRLHAIMILGGIPGEMAGQGLIAALYRMSDQGDDLLWEWLAGYWPALFRNKPEATQQRLHAIAEDGRLHWYPRHHAVDCVLAHATSKSPEALEQALDWLANLIAAEDEDEEFCYMAGCTLLDFALERHRPLLEKLADQQENLGMGAIFVRSDVNRSFNKSKSTPEWERFDNPWEFYDPKKILERQQRWYSEGAAFLACDEEDQDEVWQDHRPSIVDTFTREQPKVGRNDPCPCGSGKKYKKCCLH